MLLHNSFQLSMCCSDIKAPLLCCVTVSLRSNTPPRHSVTAESVRASHTGCTCFCHRNFHESTTDEQHWAALKCIPLVSRSIMPMLLFLSEQRTKKRHWLIKTERRAGALEMKSILTVGGKACFVSLWSLKHYARIALVEMSWKKYM